ncbi:SGNH/GDSL hydrolase family protein [Acidipila sp. EB88]|uniref:SGNH/GDSL hydrolase family protein n=1 Tax=Acidipila sp. EB88 TaxID=2305226 RepID=UPI0013153E75|nr:SGNH/GDSL hydrolase family protein [Acidipila sp. EB88]
MRLILGLGDRPLMQADHAAGYVLKPNQHLFRFFAHTDVNSFSMRSPEVMVMKPAGTYRVLLVGDSMTYGGTQVDQKKIFASLLATELPAQLHRPVEVLNASDSAYGIGNELGYLQSRGTFNADLVLLVLNSGDMGQSTSTLADVGGESSTTKSPCALCELWTRYVGPRLFHIKRKLDAGSQFGSDSPANVGPNLERLNEFQQAVAGNHARMGVVFLAARSWIHNSAEAAATPSLVQWAAQHQVPLLDVTGAEMPYSSKEITLDGIHFNAKGHRIAATAIEQHWAELTTPLP